MKSNRGFSLIELLIVVAIIGIIAAIAIPNLVRTRDAANEASGLSSTRTIVTSQITFASTIGGGNFAPGLGELTAAGLIDEVLGAGAKDNYVFVTAGNGSLGFTVTATPQGPNAGNMRSFYSDETGVIRSQQGPGANAGSPPLGGGLGGGGGGEGGGGEGGGGE